MGRARKKNCALAVPNVEFGRLQVFLVEVLRGCTPKKCEPSREGGNKEWRFPRQVQDAAA
jgi:hypothetical protein